MIPQTPLILSPFGRGKLICGSKYYRAKYSLAKDNRFSLRFCLSEECSRGLALGNENDASAFYSSFFIRLLLFFILSLHHQIINEIRIELIRDLFIFLILVLVLFDRLLLSYLNNSAFLLFFFLPLFLNQLLHLYFYYLLFNLLLLTLILLILLVVNRNCFFNDFFYVLFNLSFVFIVFTVLVFFLVLYDDVDATLSASDDFATQVNLFFLLKF